MQCVQLVKKVHRTNSKQKYNKNDSYFFLTTMIFILLNPWGPCHPSSCEP